MLSYQDVRDSCYLVFRLQARLAYIDSTMRLLQEEHGENANLDTYYSDEDRFAKELIEAEKDMSRALVELFSNVQLLKNLKISHSTYLNRRYISSAIEEIRQAVQLQPRLEQERIAIGFGKPFELGKKWHKLDDEFNVT
ncbi:hypothetical protein VB10N_03720 [Vibrio sp. 10N]|nr:hypothetical protein VB10N_03720 [Vibrio sp. 10N]